MRRSLERIGASKVVLALSAARTGDAVGNSILFVIIPLYVAKLPAPWFPLPETVRAGLLISLYGLVNALLQPLAGALVDSRNKRKIFIQCGLVLMGVSTFAYIFATRFTDILLLRILQGVGLALTVTASMAIMAISTDKKSRGGSMGVYSTSRMLGLSAGPLLGGYLYDHFGFNAAFYAGTAFVALGILLVQLWITEIRLPVSSAAQRPVFKIIDRKLLTPGIVGAGLAIFVMAAAFSMVTPLEQQFNTRLHESAFSFGIAFSAVMFSRLLFQIPVGRLSDHVGRKPVIIAGLILMAPVTALLGEVGIAPGHTPLVTQLAPGEVRVKLADGGEEAFYVSGGLLEVQPKVVTVLSDTAVRAEDLDEAAVLKAKEEAERQFHERSAEVDYATAQAQLAETVAQLQTIQRLRRRSGR